MPLRDISSRGGGTPQSVHLRLGRWVLYDAFTTLATKMSVRADAGGTNWSCSLTGNLLPGGKQLFGQRVYRPVGFMDFLRIEDDATNVGELGDADRALTGRSQRRQGGGPWCCQCRTNRRVDCALGGRETAALSNTRPRSEAGAKRRLRAHHRFTFR